jgi:hypothetical protein
LLFLSFYVFNRHGILALTTVRREFVPHISGMIAYWIRHPWYTHYPHCFTLKLLMTRSYMEWDTDAAIGPFEHPVRGASR